MNAAIADVQSSLDTRNLPINQVGIKDLRFPARVREKSGGAQHTAARYTMTVSLPAEQKGTHMSRFVALLEERDFVLDYASLHDLCREMLARLNAEAGEIRVAFPFFRTKTAPVSAIRSLLDYDVELIGSIGPNGYRHILKATVPVTSLCPCSKEISRYGAHNQRSHVTATLQCREHIAIEDVLDTVEAQASCGLYGLLKRPDEKYVTERAYENPKFVEDLVRDTAAALRQDARIEAFVVESENFESIHNHSAYAKIIG